MINDTTSEPGNEVPEADWAEQQQAAEPVPDQPAAPRLAPERSGEADRADLGEQELEVVLDEEA